MARITAVLALSVATLAAAASAPSPAPKPWLVADTDATSKCVQRFEGPNDDGLYTLSLGQCSPKNNKVRMCACMSESYACAVVGSPGLRPRAQNALDEVASMHAAERA